MDVFKTLILDTPDTLSNISGVLPVANGGTGANNAPDARVNLLPDYTGNANKVLSLNGTATDVEWTSNGAGDVAGPASSTDNAVARFDSTTGKVIQNSGVTISDANLLTADALSINNNTTLGSSNTDTVTFNARIASEFTPATDNTYDLGGTGHEWRDLYIDGTANIDSLVADTADINGGTIDGTTIGATTPSTGAFTTASASTSVTTPSVTNAGTLALSATGANVITASTNGSERMRITSAGNVGIGTTGPQDILHVNKANGSGDVAAIIQNYATTNGETASLRFRTTTSNDDFGAVVLERVDSLGSYMHFDVRDAGASRRAVSILHSGNVGIGTTSPQQRLDVTTASLTEGSGLAVTNTQAGGYGSGINFHSIRSDNSANVVAGAIRMLGASNWNSDATTSSDMRFFTVGANTLAERMRIDSSGNLGLGVTPSAWSSFKAIDLQGGGAVASYSAGTPSVGIYQNAYFNGSSYIYKNNGNAQYIDLFGGNGVRFFQAPSGTAGNAISFTQAMTLDASGNLGIGTTSPATRLDVQGVIQAGNGTYGLQLGTGWGGTSTNTYLATNGASTQIVFGINGSEKMRVDSSGNVGIGTTSPAAKLHVVGDIVATGNITAYYSDDRLKTKLGNIENALDKVSKLNGFYYEANETAQALGYKPVREVGLSAQQVEAVLPEVVAPAPIDNEYKTLHYERVIPLLVEAIKELKAEIELLKK